MYSKRLLVFVGYLLSIMVIMASVASASSYYSQEKRAQNAAFMMQNRYGRAGGSGKNVIVAPRTDKFFLSSRYGKRSSDPPLRTENLVYPINICANDDLSCSYTGVANLYRCAQSVKKESTGEALLLPQVQ